MSRQYSMTDTRVERPTCKTIVVMPESDPDMSPMRANRDAETDLFDAEDIRAFEADEWGYVGIYAVATVYVPLGAGGATFIVDIPGPGLWGVESNAGEAYHREVGDEQVGELRAVLDALNISHNGATVEYKL